MAIGLGSEGVVLTQYPMALVHAATQLAEPEQRSIVVQGDQLSFALENTQGIKTAQYVLSIIDHYELEVDNNRVTTEESIIGASQQAPFTAGVVVPAQLRNGQPFFIRTRIETFTGEVIEGAERRVVLHGEELPQNEFDVELFIDSTSYMPKPFKIEALINNSKFPVQQVEYYISENKTADEAYQMIGKHYGPEYVIYRNYEQERNGHYIKVRAIDIYGNVAESAAKPITRQYDSKDPTLSLRVEGESLHQPSKQVIEGHSFEVVGSYSDEQSGVDVAFLYRNDELVKAEVGGDQIHFTETAPVKGQQLNYRLVVKDHSKNTKTTQLNYTVIEDTKPKLTGLEINGQWLALHQLSTIVANVRERSSFNIIVAANDDVELDRAEVVWNGFSQTKNFDKSTRDSVGFAVNDLRDARVPEAGEKTTLTVKLYDNARQVRLYQVPVKLVRDQAPNIEKLEIEPPVAGIYGNNAPISLNNLHRIDDGGKKQLVIQIYQIMPNGEHILVEETTPRSWRNYLNISLGLPSIGAYTDDNYRFKAKVIDSLGQYAESEIFTIPLTQKPNTISFATSGDLAINPTNVRVGDTAIYQVKVLDSAAKPVANQKIQWYLVADDNRDDPKPIVISSTDAAGIAQFTFDTVREAKKYFIQAKLTDYSYIGGISTPVTIVDRKSVV